jgi:phospholipase C
MHYKQNGSIVALVALAAVVLITVVHTIDMGSPRIALAAAASSHFRHYITSTPSSFRHYVTSTPSSFRHFTNTTANATVSAAATTPTTTPIKRIIVIFQENNSFDHYFGTYPNATNPTGQPTFIATPGTPTVNNLLTPKNLLAPNNLSTTPNRSF